jgi:hypothetical protein
MYIEISTAIPQEDSEYCNTGVHSFFRHLEDMSKHQAPEEWHEVSSIYWQLTNIRSHRIQFSCQAELAPESCAPLHQNHHKSSKNINGSPINTRSNHRLLAIDCRRIVGYLRHIHAYDSIFKQDMTAFIQNLVKLSVYHPGVFIKLTT